MKLEDSGKQTNSITTLKLKWKKFVFIAWIKGAERDPLGTDVGTNGSENSSSFTTDKQGR
jgi:hypothetical protein